MAVLLTWTEIQVPESKWRYDLHIAETTKILYFVVFPSLAYVPNIKGAVDRPSEIVAKHNCVVKTLPI